MRSVGMSRLFVLVVLAAGTATPAVAQDPATPTREAAIEQEQAEKVKALHPYVPGKAEALFNRAEDILVNGVPSWHPFFTSAYYGGGFTLGAGYAHHVSPYNMIDVRGSYTILGYKLLGGGVDGASPVPSPRRLVRRRWLARSDTGGLLRNRNEHVAG